MEILSYLPFYFVLFIAPTLIFLVVLYFVIKKATYEAIRKSQQHCASSEISNE